MRRGNRPDPARKGREGGIVSERRADLAAIATLLLLALVWGWPIASRLATAIPGTSLDRDVATMVWNVGWVEQALRSGYPLLATDRVLLPFGADLRLHTYSVFPAVIVSPIAWWRGTVTAFNVLLLATVALNGIVAYLLFRNLPARPAAALVAATALMLGGPVLEQMRVGRPIFAAIWMVCAALLLARLLLARPRSLPTSRSCSPACCAWECSRYGRCGENNGSM